MDSDAQIGSAQDGNAQDYSEVITETFFNALYQAVEAIEGVTVEMFDDAIQKRQTALEASNRDLISDAQSEAHLSYTTLVIAAYETLLEHLSQTEAYALVEEAFTAPLYEATKESVSAELDRSEDPFALLRSIGLAQEADVYGEGFTFEHEANDGEKFLQNVTRCFYHDAFTKNGRPELTPIFCKSDAAWIDGINPDKHSVRFERPTTLGKGHDKCRFHFFRGSKDER